MDNQWRAWQPPVIQSATLKSCPEDFQVTEHLPFELTGEGEHLFLFVEKINANTQWVVKQIAQWAGVRERDVGHAGLKDRFAVTRQWLSVYRPGQGLPETLPEGDDFRVLKSALHNKKLRVGSVRSNQFCIRLRDVVGERSLVEQRLERLSKEGFPNYFGSQRFGHGGSNVAKARAMLLQRRRVKKSQQSILLSAVRSWFFNQYLALRLTQQSWLTPVAGDRINLAGTRSFFVLDTDDDTITQRLIDGDVHIAGPLPGKDFTNLQPAYAEFDRQIWQAQQDCLEAINVITDFRPLRAMPQALEYHWVDEETLEISFALSSGSYATSLLQELGNINEPERDR
ncbi:MAG: tRNA pseudouridine(13) synthase TruD [Gammaproteobacteria bacterium]|nr:tRNA pseudouridine(13) synthase TruD [Gammaproteobacteria bacterium]